MNTNKRIGLLIIIGAIGVFIPYTLLTISFEYPDILRQDAGIILTKFHDGGSQLIFTWWAFAILGIPLLIAYKMIGEKFKQVHPSIGWATTIGIISVIVQMIGLLRWVFVVPVIAKNYVMVSPGSVEQTIAKANFQSIHQFGGVLLGEHIGQIFTIIWTIAICCAFFKANYFPRWINWFGIIASLIYLFAQAELFATVIPGFPVWDMAGFIGSTLWLLWLLILGILFLKKKENIQIIS